MFPGGRPQICHTCHTATTPVSDRQIGATVEETDGCGDDGNEEGQGRMLRDGKGESVPVISVTLSLSEVVRVEGEWSFFPRLSFSPCIVA